MATKKRQPPAGSKNGATRPPRVRVRMYRQGLGDAFLLTFDPEGEHPAHVLIDLGTIGKGSGVDIDEVVKDVLEVTGGHLAAVVATHEHQDHVSGFIRARAAGLEADEAWLAWTEDEDDPDARELEQYRGDLVTAAVSAATALEGTGARDDEALAGAVWDVLGFQGAKTALVDFAAARRKGLKKRTSDGMNAAREMARSGAVRHFSPGDVIQRPWAPGVRFFVLGPPRDTGALHKLGEHGSPDLYELAASAAIELPGREPAPPPFDARFNLPALPPGLAELHAEEPWRHIDGVGLGCATELALQLDNVTNNTSLVLAIEVDGDRVLLFPADAQLGSWLTWGKLHFTVAQDGRRRDITGHELLERTVFYKVGHHASHNATATRAGLELMGGAGLTAFVPLDAAVAVKKKWPMPATKLAERLRDKTRGRVFRSDNAEAAEGVDVTGTFVDYSLPSLEADHRLPVAPPSRPPPPQSSVRRAPPPLTSRRRSSGRTRSTAGAADRRGRRG